MEEFNNLSNTEKEKFKIWLSGINPETKKRILVRKGTWLKIGKKNNWIKYYYNNDIMKTINIVEDEQLTSKGKGDNFEKYCKCYLETFYPNHKTYLYSDIPMKIISKYKLPITDKGLDLIMINSENQIYGVQCKYRSDENSCVPYGEVSTFAGMLNHLDYGIYMSNTKYMCQELHDINKVIPILKRDFEDFIYDETASTGKSTIQNITKRDYQLNAIEAGKKHFETNTEGELIMACGTGKTLVSFWIIEQFLPKKVIYVVPSLLLVNQTYRELLPQNYFDKVILFCSDAEIKIEEKIINISTDENIFNNINPDDKLLVISTYNSLSKLANINFDFAIFDEFHKIICGEEFKKDVEDCKSEKKLYMTATKKVITSDDEIDTKTKNVFFKYGFDRAIEDGYLCDYDIILYTYTENEIENYARKNNIEKNHYLINQIILDKLYSGKIITKCLTYFSRVENAKVFSNNCSKMDFMTKNVSNYTFSGDNTIKYRSKCVESFISDELSALHTAKVLQEGINIPSVDSVFFCDPRESQIDIIQCIGRALRLSQGKTMAHIIIPIQYDESIDADNFNSKYDFMVSILGSLNKHDDRIIKEIRQAKSEKRKPKFMKYFESEEMDVKFDKLRDFYERIDYIIIKDIESLRQSWDKRYEEVKKYLEENNKYPSRNSENEEIKSLSEWVSTQRKNIKKLSSERKKMLESLSEWQWKVFEIKRKKTWDASYEELKKYLEKNNNKYPSRHSENEEIKLLRSWVSHQRQNIKKLSLDNRKNQLELLMGWIWNANDESWNNSYEELKKYLSENNNKYPSSISINEEIKKIGRWVINQRQNIKNNKISEKRLNLLNKIDFK